MKIRSFFQLLLTAFLFLNLSTSFTPQVKPKTAASVKHYLYVAVPGIRDYLGYGGHGILVFDMDNNHRFVKRIQTSGYHPDKTPSNVKGVAVSISLNSIYISTWETLQRIDLTTGKIVWEKEMEGGCDRMAISPDGKTMYLPAFEKKFWMVVDCATGNVIAKIDGFIKSHNSLYGPSGNYVYLGDIRNPWLYMANTKTNTIEYKVGPFFNYVRPFTLDSK
jgi:DNA-binding beta-propeller fold protein YncE